VDNRFRPLRAVFFVLTCLALLAFTYILVFRVDFGGSTVVTVRFDGVGTIQSGSPVRQSGVKVGSVARVALSQEDRRSVDVDLSLYRGLIVRTKDQISIVTGGLLGDQYIDIVPGSPDAPIVGPGDRLTGRTGLDLKLLVDGGSSLVQDLGATTRTIAAFLAAHSDSLDRLLADAERGVRHAADAAEKADRLLGKAEAAWDPAAADAQTALRALKETSQTLKVMIDGLGAPGSLVGLLSSPATAKTASQSLAQATETLANLQAASKSLKTVTDALESALK
jgi:phospholipid/cholesterol/gamma-HCH transport system substrate-binding protein